MVDTQKIQAAPRCISGVAEVAATLARARDGATSAIEVATCFPLDVETVGRILDGLGERPGVHVEDDGALRELRFESPDDYNVRLIDLDAGEQLASNESLLRHLRELRGDEAWVRKVRDQHTLLRAAPALSRHAVALGDLARRAGLTRPRAQSALNDLGSQGYISVGQGRDPVYTFPPYAYPRARYQHNMRLLDELVPSAPFAAPAVMVAALALAIVAALLAWSQLA